MRNVVAALALVTSLPLLSASCLADELVTTSGSVYKGLVVSQDAGSVTFAVIFAGGGRSEMTFPRSLIQSLTVDGKMPPAPPAPAPSSHPASMPATRPADPPKPPASQPAQQGKYKDGTFNGSAKGFHGEVTLAVKLKNSRIETIQIVSQNDTKRYWDRAVKIIPVIIKQNGTEGVATVTRATFSSKGIIGAVNDAMNKALRTPPK